EFTTEVSDVNRERFSRYSGYVRSIDYNQIDLYRGHEGRPSDRIMAIMFHLSTSSGSVLPKLTTVRWLAIHKKTLMQLLLFLVPTITTLRISCWNPLESACVKILKYLAQRNILLTQLEIAMAEHTQTFLEVLSEVLANQRRLIRVRLPYYTASRQVVAALGELPSLENYGSWTFIEYQAPLERGMEFDWVEGAFTGLKTFGMITSVADAVKIMSRPHQPRLDDLRLISRDFFEPTHLHKLCSSLSTSQPSLTILYLSLYSRITGPDLSSHTISFDLLRPLLSCTALRELCVYSDLAMVYNDKDIVCMASAWSSLEILALCPDPASNVGLATGQPLQSVGSFAQSFRTLRELSLYLNTLHIDVISGVCMNLPQARLSVLNFGTSPIPTNGAAPPDISVAIYVASLLEPRAEIKIERGASHTRFMSERAAAKAEYSRREEFWSSFVTEVHTVLSSTRYLTQEDTRPPC
ncbi:hypothetical protein FRB98_002571, partial [Tulasnella sp. 332]